MRPPRLTPCQIEALHSGLDMSIQISRAKFEELNADLFRRTLAPVTQVGAASVVEGGASDADLIERDRVFRS